MSTPDLTEARSAAVNAVNAAAEVIAAHLQTGDWQIRTKADDSPVTDVDVAAERAIRAVLAEATPDIAFYGEETGRSDTPAEVAANRSGERSTGADANGSLWLVDPIDGTKSFIRGMPFYSTQIALQVAGELVVGVSNAPAWGERLIAVQGLGVSLNSQPVATREVTRIEDAFLSTGNLSSLASDSARWQAFARIVKRVKRTRGYGDFCHYHQLCCGQTDLIIESDLNILDIAALTVAVREAGGVITDIHGDAIGLHTSSVLAAGTASLHRQALELLSVD
jgi:histidinol-phosphatase